MKKRIGGLLLALCMIISIMPCVVSAEIIASGECGADGDNLTWTLDSDGLLTISGEGAMKDYEGSEYSPWDYWRVKTVVIESGVTTIGEAAFCWCYNLKSAELPDTLTSINGGAFHYCENLKSLSIPDSVIYIDDYLFYDCVSLENIDIGENNPNYCSVDGVVFTKDKTKLFKYPVGKTEEDTLFPTAWRL